MMAGVGIMLAKVAIDMARKSPLVGAVSIATALLTYYATPNPADKLVYTIVASVVISTIVCIARGNKSDIDIDESREKFVLQKFTFNSNVIRGALGLLTLNIGANIAFGNITAQNLAKAPINIDHLTIVSSLADMASALFGGAPVESIISATGAAPHPVASGVLMMTLMAIILAAKLLPKIGKYVPSESIAGFLLVLGAIVTVPINAGLALASGVGTADAIVGGVAMTVTAISDPFFGMMSGLLIKVLLALFA
jgi:AGZA family xanthine/uracil permease-like MFS transporter